MRVVIVEDERLSADRLARILKEINPEIEIVAMLNSVESASSFFGQKQSVDLLLLDIQLNDGTGFDLLNELTIQAPVIFTTAYNTHAIKAFKYNSIDYLLKPIEKDELMNALEKLKNFSPVKVPNSDKVGSVLKDVDSSYKKRFLIKIGEHFKSIATQDIAYFTVISSDVFLVTNGNMKLPIDYALDQLEEKLDPVHYFRVNRKTIVNITAIKEIAVYFNSRLILSLAPAPAEQPVVSRDRVGNFKKWIDC